MIPFKQYHLQKLLESYEGSSLPLDRLLHDYFRTNKSLGSKDRAYIAENAYGIIRYLSLIDHLTPKPLSWEKRISTFLEGKWKNQPQLPTHLRLSYPLELYSLITESWGDKTEEICRVSNETAPTTVRVNTLKTTRDDLLKRWKDLDVVPASSPNAINLKKRLPLFTFPEFKEGLFEVQDEASQMIAALVQTKPGDQVLDFCAGSGGKTLAFAPALQHQGQIYLHDVRPTILHEARKRLNRAGIQNAQFILPETTAIKRLKHRCDWILVDAPCSGTGTLRRNPDMKWRITREMVQRLVEEQRAIFTQALQYLKPGGHIVYATCSILKEENQEQIQYFIDTHHLELEGNPLQTLPTSGGMDGFFGAVLFKKE